MTERESLLAACLNEPSDDTSRSVYADWLRDRDSPLGRFIWAGVTLSKFRGTRPVEDGMFFDAQRELLAVAETVLTDQLKAILGWEWKDIAWDSAVTSPDRIHAVHLSLSGKRTRGRGWAEMHEEAIYSRGMLAGLRLRLRDWQNLGSKVLAVCPLEFVEVIDVPGLTLRIAPEGGKWRLTGELKLPAIRVGQHPQPARTLTELWSIGARDRFAHYIRTATDDIIELLRMEAGDRWPVPQLFEAELYEDAVSGPIDSEDM